jgi:FixJ family two-component response regulator
MLDDDASLRDSPKLLLEAHEDYASIEEFVRGHIRGRRACLILEQDLPGARGLIFLAAQDGTLVAARRRRVGVLQTRILR